MKVVKSFKKFFWFFPVFKIDRGRTSRDKIFIQKTIPFVSASVLIPCFLQYWLVFGGQNGPDVVNGFLMPVEGIREGVKSDGPIFHGGYLNGEGGFVSGDSGSDFRPFISPIGKSMDGNITEKGNHKSNKSECSFSFQDEDYWLQLLFLFLFVGFVIAHSG